MHDMYTQYPTWIIGLGIMVWKMVLTKVIALRMSGLILCIWLEMFTGLGVIKRPGSKGQMFNIRIPWFRIHATVLNDPGRILSVHIMHTALIAGWSGTMAGYERSILNGCDPIYNPLWRQGSYVFPFMTRIGVSDSVVG